MYFVKYSGLGQVFIVDILIKIAHSVMPVVLPSDMFNLMTLVVMKSFLLC